MIRQMLTNWKTRRDLNRKFNETYNELSRLNSRDLADMGIHRSQIRDIATEAVYG